MKEYIIFYVFLVLQLSPTVLKQFHNWLVLAKVSRSCSSLMYKLQCGRKMKAIRIPTLVFPPCTLAFIHACEQQDRRCCLIIMSLRNLNIFRLELRCSKL